jgi:glycosyltransferase involved in cell wall biosynthesis
VKILFIARASLYTDRGGDTIQILKTAEYLVALGVEVDVRLTDEKIDYTPYQLVHFFNLIRPADILKHIKAAGKPYVISPVFVDYAEADRFTRRWPVSQALRLFSADRIEYFKAIARRFRNGEKIISPAYLWYGHRGSIRSVIRGAAMLLPNSENEYNRLQRRFRIDHSYRVIPNAIDAGMFRPAANAPDREPDLVLCVARIEGRKNQLNLIKAVNGSAFRLILVGNSAVNQRGYYDACRKAAGPGITFIDALPQEQLPEYYSRARVHILPSWFETTGLSSLEAAAMGCSIVVTDKGDAREYFGEAAIYCDPESTTSILQALARAAMQGPAADLREKIASRYTWAHTAADTLRVYREVLDVNDTAV